MAPGTSAPRYQPPPDQGLDILYQDDYLLVVNKSHGLLTVPGRGEDKQDCLLSRVHKHLPEALVVHRLDMETSGLVVLALHRNIQRELGLLFEKRRVKKQYQAIVAGKVDSVTGEINLPLLCDWPNRPRQKVDFPNGKPSQTHYQALEYLSAGNTRLQLTPVTGRSHQLRVHLQAVGHPILGDRLYAMAEIAAQAPRMLLHAEKLEFTHPVSRQPVLFQSHPPF